MNERQYNLVKLFLDKFHVPPKKLATKWDIELTRVLMVDSTPNFEAYYTMPEEDLLTFFGRTTK
jgi:hypothetical protein